MSTNQEKENAMLFAMKSAHKMNRELNARINKLENALVAIASLGVGYGGICNMALEIVQEALELDKSTSEVSE